MSKNTPTRPAESRWTCLNTTVDEPDQLGAIAMHFTLQSEDGFIFVVSVSGEGRAQGRDFVDALRMAQARIVMAAGGKFEGARLASRPN